MLQFFVWFKNTFLENLTFFFFFHCNESFFIKCNWQLFLIRFFHSLLLLSKKKPMPPLSISLWCYLFLWNWTLNTINRTVCIVSQQLNVIKIDWKYVILIYSLKFAFIEVGNNFWCLMCATFHVTHAVYQLVNYRKALSFTRKWRNTHNYHISDTFFGK